MTEYLFEACMKELSSQDVVKASLGLATMPDDEFRTALEEYRSGYSAAEANFVVTLEELFTGANRTLRLKNLRARRYHHRLRSDATPAFRYSSLSQGKELDIHIEPGTKNGDIFISRTQQLMNKVERIP